MEKPDFPAHMANYGVGRPIYLLKLLGVAALYALLAKIVLTFFSANGVVSIVWPPSGLALAMLLIGGKRYFPGVFLGAFLANAMTGLALGVSAAIAMGNTLEALLGIWLLNRDGRFDSNLRALGDYLRLIALGGFVACSVAALNGSTTLLVSGFITAEAYFHNLLYWWMGDALGIIIVAPLILAWRRIPDGWLEPKRMTEAILLFVLAFLVGQIIFLGWFQGTNALFNEVANGYWIFLFVSWLAVRFGIGAVVIALAMVAIQALFGAALGVGFFANDITKTGLINYWFYIITLSVVGMALAIHFSEHKQLERQLSRRLRHRDVMERITRISLNSANIEELLGKVLDEILIVFDADRAWFLYPCDPDAPSWSVPMERTRPGWPGAFARGMVIPMTPEVAEVFREVLASTKPLPYGPAASRGIPAAVAGQFSIRSQIQMALRPRTGSPWTMGLHHCAQAQAYDEDDLLLFNDIGLRVADALSSMTILKNLRESEESLNRAQAVGQIGSWLLDIPSNRLEWSAETYRMFGMPQQQAIDLETFVATVHPDDRDFVLKAWGEALAGAPYDIEHRIVVDGQTRWVRERALIQRDAEGRTLTGIGTVQDITERKQAERALFESEKLYRSLFENMLNGFAYCQMLFEQDQPQDFIYLSVNKAFETLTGLKNVVGKKVSEVIPGIQQADARLFEIYGRVSLSGKSERLEIYVEALQQWFWISVYSPQKDYFVVVFDVITERKQAEEKLRASEQKFMRLFMEIPIPLGVADKEGVIAHFNNKFTEVFGYTVDDVPTLDEWWLKAYPDETYRRWVLDNWNDAVAKATKEGTNVESAEYRVTCKNGAERMVIIGGSPVAGGVLAIFNDITERKRAERTLIESETRFRNLVETTSDWIWEVDENFAFTYVSPKIHDILGHDGEKIIGKTPFDLMTAEEAKRVAGIAGVIAATKTPFSNLENTNLHKDGHSVVIETSGVPIIDTEGKFCGYRGINRDITDRKEHEEELKRSNADLEQFSYAVSHDMRQPLRMISSYLQLLERSLAGQLDGEKRDYFNFAIDGAKRIDQMLVALLEYSRIGRMGEPPTWIDSRALLDEALQFLQPDIDEAQARVNIEGDWPRILASHDEILRLIQNLIGNAIKYRIVGRTPEIAVTGETVKNEWRLCVADNGVGIIPDQIRRLFQVFQRLQSREAYEGTGVGLALCRKIAEHHKGCIWAESAGDGQGSRLYVVLPVSREMKHLQ